MKPVMAVLIVSILLIAAIPVVSASNGIQSRVSEKFQEMKVVTAEKLSSLWRWNAAA